VKRVFVNGTFDMLHHGHLCLLNYARAQGDYLLVGIDSDQRVSELKGPDRPINCEEHRAEMLINLRCVDEVEIFHGDEELKELMLSCDLMVKGSDHQNKSIVGEGMVKTIFYPRLDYSTTGLIEIINDRR
jgi:D-beta-D-heptose 7-phosphate kinase/D-beta-D-heptose 1-phosphate adenosyltransferase